MHNVNFSPLTIASKTYFVLSIQQPGHPKLEFKLQQQISLCIIT